MIRAHHRTGAPTWCDHDAPGIPVDVDAHIVPAVLGRKMNGAEMSCYLGISEISVTETEMPTPRRRRPALRRATLRDRGRRNTVEERQLRSQNDSSRRRPDRTGRTRPGEGRPVRGVHPSHGASRHHRSDLTDPRISPNRGAHERGHTIRDGAPQVHTESEHGDCTGRRGSTRRPARSIDDRIALVTVLGREICRARSAHPRWERWSRTMRPRRRVPRRWTG